MLVGRAANPPGADTGSDPRTVLDLAPGGRLVAVADRIGPDTTDLVIGRPDGSQLRMTMPGLLAGAFGPDGAQLAVIDGLGRLQIVSTGDGTARIAADGPFLGPLTYDEGGVMLLAVSSVEAPFVSRLGRVFPDTGAFASLDDAELAYSGTLLADGSIAVVAHTPTGPTVRRRQSGLTTVLAELEPGAIHVAVAPDGGRIAWEADGGIFVRAADGSVRGLGSGSRPRFAPDGRALLVDDGGQATLLVLASGTRIPLGSSGAVFDRCVTGCPS